LISLLVAGFIFYLYAPHLLFKFAAASKYDLITRKEIPQVEEFFAASLPGLVLNALAAFLLRGTSWLFRRPPITIDWQSVAMVFDKEPNLSAYVRGDRLAALFTYAAVLGGTAWVTGRLYGTLKRKIVLADGEAAYLEASFRDPRSTFFRYVARVNAIFFTHFWDVFYAQYHQPFYPVVLRNSYAFVHTTRGLYHGIVFGADKKRDGDIEGILLISVSKFSRGTEAELVRAGKNPITDLTGPLFIKWSEITDINYPPDDGILKTKRTEYQRRIDEAAKRTRRRHTFLRRLTAAKKLSTAETVTTNG
jgi:hypothetical protein